ncbi:MAG: hypothetical protein CM15mP83_4390 [Flavobacteriaceae bacterium]|nr:MAG: hypothetical protein CM15mP83_4390 [Flavobacteriaceae bacterium]
MVDENSDGVGEIKMPNLTTFQMKTKTLAVQKISILLKKEKYLHISCHSRLCWVEESDGDAGEDLVDSTDINSSSIQSRKPMLCG